MCVCVSVQWALWTKRNLPALGSGGKSYNQDTLDLFVHECVRVCVCAKYQEPQVLWSVNASPEGIKLDNIRGRDMCK